MQAKECEADREHSINAHLHRGINPQSAAREPGFQCYIVSQRVHPLVKNVGLSETPHGNRTLSGLAYIL